MIKTEDGEIVGEVQPSMIPQKRGRDYVSEAVKKLKTKEEEVTKLVMEKKTKRKQGSENITRYVSNALSGNEALDWFQKKEEEAERAKVEKENCKIEREEKKKEREHKATERHLWQDKLKAEFESKRLKEELTRM